MLKDLLYTAAEVLGATIFTVSLIALVVLWHIVVWP